MAYKEVAGKRLYPKYGESSPGDVLVEGTFTREFQGKFGVQFEFQSVSGDVVVLGKAGQLVYKMGFITPGEKLKVIYQGMTKMPSGQMAGKDAHQFTTLRDDDFNPAAGDEVGDQVLCDEGIAEFDNL